MLCVMCTALSLKFLSNRSHDFVSFLKLRDLQLGHERHLWAHASAVADVTVFPTGPASFESSRMTLNMLWDLQGNLVMPLANAINAKHVKIIKV